MFKACLLTGILVAGLTGCGGDKGSTNPAHSSADTAQAAAPVDAITAALAQPGRLAFDLKQDETRKSAELMTFFGIAPGMTVLDLYSGGGYNSELMAYIVGQEGEVWAHNNTPYLSFAKTNIEARYTPGRLANVKRILAENNELNLPAGKFDAVLMVMTYHDIYHVHEESGWTRIDGPQLLSTLYMAMKPGAVLAVVDHSAVAGATPETGETLHRIDPELARKEILVAGFVFEAESDVLRNRQDDRTLSAFDPAIRGRTDKFVFRFRRP